MDRLFEIAQLIEKEIRKEISESEKAQLNDWRNESDANESVYQRLTDDIYLAGKVDLYDQFDQKKALKSVREGLNGKQGRVVEFRSAITWLRYAASIVLPLIMGAGIIYYFVSQNSGTTMATIDAVITPGRDQAVLVLSDGEEVDLDAEETFETIQQGNVNTSKSQNRLEYQSEGNESTNKSPIYNELITPKGGFYKLRLADGTQVTLNADSKLKFPVDFTDSTRSVYLTGEAFFEVTHSGKPFIVNTEQIDVTVLGTKFNVSAYSEESQIQTTLVEGKVKVETGSLEALLAPNDQATWSENAGSIEVQQVNPRYYISWMNGKLDFNNLPLELVIKQLSRWYDFEYRFESEEIRNYHFTATFDNDQPISKVLETLSLTTDIEFQIENETTIIIK